MATQNKSSNQTQSPPAEKSTNFALALQKFRDKCYTNLGGPKIMPMRYVINLFKGFTFIWILFLMFTFDNFSRGMYLYLFLHGTYGIAWLIKDIAFPDASFKQQASVISLIVLSGVLFGYWTMPVMIAMGWGVQQPTHARIILCVGMYLVGLFLMIGSDYQKTTTLAKRKGLISTGFFARTRNPNYLGEMLIYGSFATCTGYWLAYALVISIWCTLFAINMYLKDELSYKFKEGWKEYKQRSYMVLPKIFTSDLINFAIYIGIAHIIYSTFLSCCDGHDHHGHEHEGIHNHTHHH